MMITKDQLAQLRAERLYPNVRVDYTINGPIQTRIVSSLETERESRILLGERAMQDALQNLRRNQALSRHQGHAKALFNHANFKI